MKTTQLKRLHNLVQVLRDAAKDKVMRAKFTMSIFGWCAVEEGAKCGTPTCGLGHYAARRDVQRTFTFGLDGQVYVGNRLVRFSHDVTRHFGITSRQAIQLFEARGCGRAKTPTQAANYIEKFIKRVSA